MVAFGGAPGQIAKTLSLKVGEAVLLLVVARGGTRFDNKKAKAALGGNARMLSAEEVEHTGHPVSRVCPFGLAKPLPVYCNVSLKSFEVLRHARWARPTRWRGSPPRSG